MLQILIYSIDRRPIVETNPDDWGEREIILPYNPRDRKYPWYQPRDPNAPKPAKETNPDDYGDDDVVVHV